LFILSYLFIKLGERDGTHFVLQLLILGFIMGVLLLVGKATIDANCEMKLNETKSIYEYGDNFTDYHWDSYIPEDYPIFHPNDDTAFLFHVDTTYHYAKVCETDNTENTFYKLMLWFNRIVVAYIILYFIYEVLIHFGKIGRMGKKKEEDE